MTKVLDHGYVKFIEAWGHGATNQLADEMTASTDMETGIIEAARMSTKGAFRDWAPYAHCARCEQWYLLSDGPPDSSCESGGDSGDHDWKRAEKGDHGLLSFLFNSEPQHATPFEFAGLTLEVQLPIFVTREWHRHRTQSYNEMSARYAPLPDINYVPTLERLMAGGGHKTSNKQAQAVVGAQPLTERNAMAFIESLKSEYALAEASYQQALKHGVPKELARVVIPVGRYTRMRATANLRNWLAFMTLRADPGAQWEIQQYAGAVGDLIALVFPRVHKLFVARRARWASMRTAAERLEAFAGELRAVKERGDFGPGVVNDLLGALEKR